MFHLNHVSNRQSVKNPLGKLKTMLQTNLERRHSFSHLKSTEQYITDAALKGIKQLNSYAGDQAVTACHVGDQNLNLELFLSSGCPAAANSCSEGQASHFTLRKNGNMTIINYNGY